MTAIVVVLLAILALVAVVMVGLLRSHADIIRALHSLGVGVGDPLGSAVSEVHDHPVELRRGPALPPERSSSTVHDVEGVTPDGDAVVVSTSASELTLFAFLTSGCASCAVMWTALADPVQRRLLPSGVRVVAVTKGPEWESPAAIAAKVPPSTVVVMSTTAWSDYEVPGSPFFVLVDGRNGVRLGEGVAQQLSQIAELVARAAADAGPPPAGHSRANKRPTRPEPSGAERERTNDLLLRSAGVLPGDPSLYPVDLDAVFARTASSEGGGLKK